MTLPAKACPQCGQQMQYRLGEYECLGCGHREAAAPPAEKTQHAGPGLKQPWQSGTTGASPGQAPPVPLYSSIGMRLPEEDARPVRFLGQEKLLFTTVWFVAQVACGVIVAGRYSGGMQTLVSLPSLIVNAVFSTLCIGVVLYYDSEALRQCCMWLLGVLVLASIPSVFVFFHMGEGALNIGLITNIVLTGWLVAILMRDPRSG
jgi:hypothetical protein